MAEINSFSKHADWELKKELNVTSRGIYNQGYDKGYYDGITEGLGKGILFSTGFLTTVIGLVGALTLSAYLIDNYSSSQTSIQVQSVQSQINTSGLDGELR